MTNPSKTTWYYVGETTVSRCLLIRMSPWHHSTVVAPRGYCFEASEHGSRLESETGLENNSKLENARVRCCQLNRRQRTRHDACSVDSRRKYKSAPTS